MGVRAGNAVAVPETRVAARRPALSDQADTRSALRLSAGHAAGGGRDQPPAQPGARPLLRERVERDRSLAASVLGTEVTEQRRKTEAVRPRPGKAGRRRSARRVVHESDDDTNAAFVYYAPC